MFGRRKSGFYPGTLTNILDLNGLSFLNPIEDFINAHLKLVIERERKGRRPLGCPLFNDAIGDGHFSAAGSAVWSAAVGHRLALLLEKDKVERAHVPGSG
jgi:hypothetical protein